MNPKIYHHVFRVWRKIDKISFSKLKIYGRNHLLMSLTDHPRSERQGGFVQLAKHLGIYFILFYFIVLHCIVSQVFLPIEIEIEN